MRRSRRRWVSSETPRPETETFSRASVAVLSTCIFYKKRLMKLISFEMDGASAWGAVTDAGVVNLHAVMGESYPDLRAVLEADAIGELQDAVLGTEATLDFEALELLPPIANPDKILCIGLNYKAHIDETGRQDADYPTVFTRFANTQIGHRRSIPKPVISDKFDYEGELALIIGKGGRNIPHEHALSHIAAYACYCDFSVRDWQMHTSQFTPGKNFPGTGAFGPWIVTADEIDDPLALDLRTRVNGNTVQDANTAQMVFSIPELIAYISTFTELVPGDIIVSGTPGGVGSRRTPRLWLFPGDEVEIEIEQVGTLYCPVGSDG